MSHLLLSLDRGCLHRGNLVMPSLARVHYHYITARLFVGLYTETSLEHRHNCKYMFMKYSTLYQWILERKFLVFVEELTIVILGVSGLWKCNGLYLSTIILYAHEDIGDTIWACRMGIWVISCCLFNCSVYCLKSCYTLNFVTLSLTVWSYP